MNNELSFWFDGHNLIITFSFVCYMVRYFGQYRSSMVSIVLRRSFKEQYLCLTEDECLEFLPLSVLKSRNHR